MQRAYLREQLSYSSMPSIPLYEMAAERTPGGPAPAVATVVVVVVAAETLLREPPPPPIV